MEQTLTIEELQFYYQEMVRCQLYELEVQTKSGKLVLKRSHLEKENLMQNGSGGVLRRRRSDYLEDTANYASPATRTVVKLSPASSKLQVPQGKVISSPIVGVFYRSSSPQSAPFVKEGDVVSSGATLCIVEAMKVMNEVKAESRCKILKILVENSKPVQSGQALFEYEPM